MLTYKIDTHIPILILLLTVFSLDFINGFFILALGLDVKLSLIKIIIIFFFFFQLMKEKRTQFLPLFVIALICIYGIFHSGIVNDKYSFFVDVSSFIKLLFPIITFFSFNIFYNKGKLNFSSTIKLLSVFFKFTLMIILINSILIKLGYSIYQYQFSDSSTGGGGLISSGNELAAMFVLMYLPTLVFFVMTKSNFFWIITCFLVYGFAMFVGGMKFSILSFAILNVYFMFLYLRINISTLIKIVVILLSVPFLLDRSLEIITPFIDRWEYFYNNLDFLTFIFSGRNLRVDYFFSHILSNISLSQFLLGFGWGTDIDIAGFGYSVYEIDFFDALYSYGLVGALLSLFIWGGATLFSIYCIFKSSNYFTKSISFSVVLLFVGSFFTGHIWFSGLIGIYLGCLFSISTFLKDKKNESFNIY